jgi:hypothetical protein
MADQTIINNYTVSQVTYSVTAGTNVASQHATAILIISPLSGYVVAAEDFSWVNTTLANIDTVVFTQDGTDVRCIVTFDNPFTMPAATTTLALCISGSAKISTVQVVGTYNAIGSSTNMTIDQESPIPETISYDISGTAPWSIQFLEKTYTAASGYFFVEDFNIDYSGFNMVVENYNCVETKTYDSNNKLTAVNLKFYYTFTDQGSIYGNNINVTIPATEATYVVDNKIRNYSFTNGNNQVQEPGAVRTVRIYGNPTTTFTLASSNGSILDIGEVTADVFETVVFYATTPTITMPASGYFDINIYIPASSSNVTYTFTLAGGNLISPFPQPNPFYIYQKAQVNLTFSASGANMVVSNVLPSQTSFVKTFDANSQPTSGASTASQVDYNFKVTGNAGQIITLNNQDTAGYATWSNLDIVNNVLSSAIANTLVLPVESATGIVAGMRFSTPYFSSSDVYTVASVNSNNVTLTGGPNLTLPDETNVSFDNRKGSELILPVTAVLNDAATEATITGPGTIQTYGDSDVTFNLDLTSVITIGSANGCVEYDIVVGNAGGTVQYYDCITKTKRVIYTNKGDTNFSICALTSPAPALTGTMTATANGDACDTSGVDQTCATWTIQYNPATTPRAKQVAVTYINCETLAEETINIGVLSPAITQCATRQTPVSVDPGDGGATITLTNLNCTP